MRATLSKDLPYDVVVDILSRLAAKTLMRLRCVCKSWNSIITHPNFITTHLNRASIYKNNNGYLQYFNLGSSSRRLVWCLLCEKTYVHHLELEAPIGSFPILIGMINGLVCLYTNSPEFGLTICLWNPSIRKSKTVSLSSSIYPSLQHSGYKKYFTIGFGFHSHTNDYKIVTILHCDDVDCEYIAKSPLPVEVYSLNMDSWRKIEAPVPCYASYTVSDVFFNGAVHWVANRSVAYPDHQHTIMSFDFGDEVFGEMKLPNSDIFRGLHLRLAVLKESLSLCVCFQPSGHCDIWVMREYGVVESWTKQFTIVLPWPRIMPPPEISMSLGIPKNNVLLLRTRSGELVSYDLESLQLKHLGIYPSYHTDSVFHFMETLVLL